MAVTEVRTQIYLERGQHETLKRMAARRSTSMAQLVREAIDRYIGDPAGNSPKQNPRGDAAWSLLTAAKEIGGSGQAYDATHLEDELYGPVDC